MSGVWRMLHHGSLGRVQSKEWYFLFTCIFLAIFFFFVFHQKMCFYHFHFLFWKQNSWWEVVSGTLWEALQYCSGTLWEALQYCNLFDLLLLRNSNLLILTKQVHIRRFIPADNHMFKVNKSNTWARSCWCRSDVFTVNLEHISHLVLMFLLSTLSS